MERLRSFYFSQVYLLIRSETRKYFCSKDIAKYQHLEIGCQE